jgi:hypothetical protein
MTSSPIVLAAASPFRVAVRVSRRHWHIGPLRVREWPLQYQDEGSERLSLGSVSVGAEAWWSVALSVPDGEGGAAADTIFVRFERHGSHPSGYRGSVEAELSLPRAEVDAIVTLLAGVVDQARRDSVLPARAS